MIAAAVNSTSELLLQLREQREICRCQIGRVWWMRKELKVELLRSFNCFFVGVRLGIVMAEDERLLHLTTPLVANVRLQLFVREAT